jgi:SEC-C motif-containing protein
MRSRYTAFVQRKLDHIERTHAPEVRHDFNRAEAERAASDIDWRGLEIHEANEKGEFGTIAFSILFRRGGQDLRQYEVARFRRIDGGWFYTGGEVSAKHPPVHVVKTGRNEPCPCNSGKKYKKCCGA